MARGSTKKERGSQQEDKKKKAYPPQWPMNNTCSTQEVWMEGTLHQKICLEAEKNVAEEVEETIQGQRKTIVEDKILDEEWVEYPYYSSTGETKYFQMS